MKLDQILNRVHHSDCVAFMKTLPDNCIDSIVTDPPYELGFMGKSWDNTGIAYNKDMWVECLRVLKPGGHLLAFSGTRTYHRMAVAIEDAGFEVRDMIEWVYGSGFPKSHNIGKAVDKLQGNEREVVGTQMLGGNAAQSTKEKGGTYASNTNAVGVKPIEVKLTKGTSEWEGWGTALKPAHEPICMARKPLGEKTVAENCLKWGTGGINIDESRVGYEKDDLEERTKRSGVNCLNKEYDSADGKEFSLGKATVIEPNNLGRFPANLIHDNSEEVRECFPDAKGFSGGGQGNGWHKKHTEMEKQYFADSGNASRFFKSIIYQAKASKSERNKGCEGLEDKEIKLNTAKYYVCRLCGKQKLSGSPCKCENPEWEVKDVKTTSQNNHPTVKPIALMEYLIKMVTREGGIVFDPFTGSGTTLIAAKKNGFQYLGTEMTEEYIPIIEARLNATEFTPKEEEIIDKGRFG